MGGDILRPCTQTAQLEYSLETRPASRIVLFTDSASEFPTLDKLYVALVDGEIDGIMLDVFKASYRANRNPEEDLVVTKIFQFPFVLGMCVRNVSDDLLNHMLNMGDTIFQYEVYDTVRNYIQSTMLEVRRGLGGRGRAGVVRSPFFLGQDIWSWGMGCGSLWNDG